MRHIFLALLVFPLLASPALADEKPKLSKADLKAILEKTREEYDVPALGAAVVSSKGLTELAVAGVRKRSDKTAATEKDRWHIGSDTKAMTAMLIALLVKQKKLTYDQTLAEAFPKLAKQMPEDLGKVTLTQCLNHTGGLPANLDWFSFDKGTVTNQRDEALLALTKAKLPAKPGEKFLYSNVGYVVAARMGERAAGKTWEQLLTSEVAKPLKMTIGFGPPGTKGKVDQPWPHKEDGTPVELGRSADNPPVMGPAGTVNCSLSDWAKFIADQLAGAKGQDGLLSAASYKMLHEAAKKGERYSPGGWLLLPGGGLGHDGSNTLNYCSALVIPKLDLAVLVVCNQGGDKKGQKATHEVRDAVLKKWLGR